MNEISQYFANYKDRNTIPNLQYGTAYTIEELYSQCIGPVQISKEYTLAWHEMLEEYINRKDAIFLLRRYENGNKKSGRWNTRRSAMTRFSDNFTYVFVSNFEAHEIYNMAYRGILPSSEEFAELLNSHQYYMHYDNGKSKSCEEYDISAYPHLGTVHSGVLNESKYYLAHLYSVNGNYYSTKSSSDYTAISKDEIEAIAPRGFLSDWNSKDEYNYPIRFINQKLSDMQKRYVIAHFLRLMDPLNYFLTPITSLTNSNSIPCKKNIGEDIRIVNYVLMRREQTFGAKIMNGYRDQIMTSPYKNKLSLSELGKTIINIEYGVKNKTSSPQKPKLSTNNVIHLKKGPKPRRNIIVQIVLFPNDVEKFKTALLMKKKARFRLTYLDGHIEEKDWNARLFSQKSNVLNNIRSKSWWRNRSTNGLCLVEVFIL